MNSEEQVLNAAPSGDQPKSDSGAENETAAKVELRKQGSNSEICIELKDEAGEQKPVEIDVADDGPNEEKLAGKFLNICHFSHISLGLKS